MFIWLVLVKKTDIRACRMDFFQKKNKVCCTIIRETRVLKSRLNKTKDWALVQNAALVIDIKVLN